ncbi:hypothetical protein ACVWYN_002875 [Pedobacter sp. UYP24]
MLGILPTSSEIKGTTNNEIFNPVKNNPIFNNAIGLC